MSEKNLSYQVYWVIVLVLYIKENVTVLESDDAGDIVVGIDPLVIDIT